MRIDYRCRAQRGVRVHLRAKGPVGPHHAVGRPSRCCCWILRHATWAVPPVRLGLRRRVTAKYAVCRVAFHCVGNAVFIFWLGVLPMYVPGMRWHAWTQGRQALKQILV